MRPFKKKKSIQAPQDQTRRAVSYYNLQKKTISSQPRKRKVVEAVKQSSNAPSLLDQNARYTTPKKTYFKRKHTLLNSILVVIVAGLLAYSATLSAEPQVVISKDTQGYLANDKTRYNELTKDVIQNASLLNKVKFTFDNEKTLSELYQAFPEAAKIELEVPLVGRHPIVKFTLAKPVIVGLYGAQKALIGTNGVVLGLVTDTYLTEHSFDKLPRVRDELGAQGVDIGTQAIKTSEVSYVTELSRQLLLQKFRVTSVTIPLTPRELKVSVEGLPFYIRLSTVISAAEQAGSIVAAINYLKEQGIVPVQYLDVRAGEKVFYQ